MKPLNENHIAALAAGVFTLDMKLAPSAGRDFGDRFLAADPTLAPDFAISGACALLCAATVREFAAARYHDKHPGDRAAEQVNQAAELCEILTDAIGELP